VIFAHLHGFAFFVHVLAIFDRIWAGLARFAWVRWICVCLVDVGVFWRLCEIRTYPWIRVFHTCFDRI